MRNVSPPTVARGRGFTLPHTPLAPHDDARRPGVRRHAHRGRSPRRLRHQGRPADRSELRQRRPLRHARRSSPSPTGRSTSTWTRRTSPSARSLDGVQHARPASQVTYTEDINDNNEFFGKVQNQLAALPEHRPRHHRADRLDGRPDDPARLDAEARPGQDAQRRDEPAAVAARPAVRHGRRVSPCRGSPASPAWPTTPTSPSEIRTIDELLTRPDLKGKVTALTRCATPSAWSCSRSATTRRTSPTRSSTTRSTSSRQAVDSGQIRQFTGNDYAPELAKGDIAACIAWSGDVIQLTAEDPKVKFVSRTRA